jgi:hypothetical protein
MNCHELSLTIILSLTLTIPNFLLQPNLAPRSTSKVNPFRSLPLYGDDVLRRFAKPTTGAAQPLSGSVGNLSWVSQPKWFIFELNLGEKNVSTHKLLQIPMVKTFFLSKKRLPKTIKVEWNMTWFGNMIFSDISLYAMRCTIYIYIALSWLSSRTVDGWCFFV